MLIDLFVEDPRISGKISLEKSKIESTASKKRVTCHLVRIKVKELSIRIHRAMHLSQDIFQSNEVGCACQHSIND